MSLATVLISNAITEIGLNLKYGPTIVSMKAQGAIHDITHHTSKEEDVKTETKTEEKRSEDKNTDPSSEVIDNVDIVADGNTFIKMQMLSKIKATNKLIEYTIYYMTADGASLLKLTDEEKKFVNGIADFFEFGKIYESAEVADITLYDLDNKNIKKETLQLAPFILSMKELEIKKTETTMERIKQRKEQINAESEHPEDDVPEPEESTTETKTEETKSEDENIIPDLVKEDDLDKIVKPIFINNEKLDTPLTFTKQGNLSKEEFEKLENHLSKYLDGVDYRYDKDGDLYNLYITRDPRYTIEDIYVIDNGKVMGRDKIYILANVPNDTVFVSVDDHEDIVKNVLANKFYILNPNEFQQVIEDYFNNLTLYSYIDMSNTGFLNKLSKDDFIKLGKKLTFIINKVKEQTKTSQPPRFRFKKWKSVNDFSIVSDGKVISPLENTGETSAVIVDGLTFIVKGDKITQKLKDGSIEYTIEKYNEL